MFKRSAKDPVAQEVLLPDAVRAKLERLAGASYGLPEAEYLRLIGEF